MLHNEQFQYSPYAYNGRGHVTDMTSYVLQEKSEIYNVITRGLLLSESVIFLRKIGCHWQRCEVVTLCDRADVYFGT